MFLKAGIMFCNTIFRHLLFISICFQYFFVALTNNTYCIFVNFVSLCLSLPSACVAEQYITSHRHCNRLANFNIQFHFYYMRFVILERIKTDCIYLILMIAFT